MGKGQKKKTSHQAKTNQAQEIRWWSTLIILQALSKRKTWEKQPVPWFLAPITKYWESEKGGSVKD